MVQDLKGNIRVFCRIRPVISNESLAFYFDGANDGDIGIMNGGTAKKTFKFDRVYTPKDDQGISWYYGACISFLLPFTTVLTMRMLLILVYTSK